MTFDLQSLISKTFELAMASGHQFASKEHLFRALCQLDTVKEFFEKNGVSERVMLLALEDIEANLPLRKSSQAEPIFSLGLQEAINLAIEMHKEDENIPLELLILQAIFEEEEGSVDHAMRVAGLQALAFAELRTSGVRKLLETYAFPVEDGVCIGRDREILRLRRILGRKNARNAVVVGGVGAGKSALMRGLAAALQNGAKEPRLWQIKNLPTLVDGSIFAENKALSSLLHAAKVQNTILLADNLSLGGEKDTHKIESFLQAFFEADVPLVVTLLPQTQQQLQKKSSLAGQLHVLHLDELDEEQLQLVLKRHVPALAAHHGVHYEASALKQAPPLARSWRKDQAQPGLSLSLLDEAGSAAALSGQEKVFAKDVRRIAKPSAKMRAEAGNLTLQQRLSQRVHGQEAAVRRIAEAAELHMAGLRDPSRTAGAFLFVGPTGVGKTELARALADEMGVVLTRFDMSEFAQPHTVSRLIGSPPGYVGFEQGGALISAIVKHPNGVLLFDEIEKAHPDIYAIFLQLMDHATVTDQSGNEADASGCFVLFTSNAGAAAAAETGVGFFTAESDAHRREQIVAKAVKTIFTPEFRGRLDDVLQFSALSEEDVLRVVDKFVAELSERLADQDVKFNVPPTVRKLLAQQGHSPTLGARPLARVVEQKLALPAARLLLQHEERPLKLQAKAKGEEVSVSVGK